MDFRNLPRLFRTLACLLLGLAVLGALPAAAESRVALLIGNNAYPSSPLRNAVNDARDLGAALRELGFKTIVKENVSRAQMIAALQEFGKALDGADAALFFYAGHAMQFKDRNYLIPVDAVIASEDDVTFFSVDVSQVLDRMERAKTRFNFVILDACRDNPFRDNFKATATGLAQMGGPSGSLIAYATAPGAVAADGFGRNGIYTGQILQNIKTPDMPVEVLFRKVREGVERDTKRLQTPWELSSIKGDFVFNPTRGAAAGAVPAGGAGPSADVSAQLELQFWKSVETSTRADDIQAYLDKYPNGVYSRLAKNRLDALLGRLQTAAAAANASPQGAQRAPAATQASSSAAAPELPSIPQQQTPSLELGARPVAPSGSGRPALAVEAPAAAVDAGGAAKAATAVAAAPAPKPKDDTFGKEIAPGVREVVFADGAIYRGGMKGGKLDGKGEYSSTNFKYQGDFKDGLKQGSGVYTWPNGDRYEGQFADDRPGGRGRWLFANGDVYEGELRAGAITGQGVYVARNGDRTEASFVQGLAQGRGTMRFANGDRYEGEMNNGALTGQGVYFYAHGGRYEGALRNGKPQGQGVYFYPDGARFEGSFENGLARALGTVYRPDGTQNKAEIVDGSVRLID